jgi:hypothetical protein
VRSFRLIDLYLHNPQWFGYPVLIALAVMASLGLEAWLEPRTTRSRALMLAPGILVWWIAPALLGHVLRLALLGGGAILGLLALRVALRHPRLAALIPVVLAVELAFSSLIPPVRKPFAPFPDLLVALPDPSIRLSAITEPGAIQFAIRQENNGRYVAPRAAENVADYGVENLGVNPDHAMLFGTETIGGYNPVQLLRYWIFVRASQHALIRYNRALFPNPPPVALDLLQVRYAISLGTDPPFGGARMLAAQGPWSLWELAQATPRVQVVGDWKVVGSSQKALDAVLAPGFDPSSKVVLETDPHLGTPSGSSGAATYRATSDQSALIGVDAPAPSVVLVRTPYEKRWRASVDGRPTRVFPADYLDQGIPVAPGHHTIVLSYTDPTIGQGLLGSGLVIVVLLGAALALHRGGRQRLDQGVAEGGRAEAA